MIGRQEQIAWRQSDFYRYSYYKLIRALFVSIAIILLLVAAIIYVVIFEVNTPSYYGTTTNGRIIPMEPMQ